MSDLRQHLIQSCHLLGVRPVLVEPEVAEATLKQIRCKTLADMIAHMINESEPLLRASADGAEVVVRELGDGTLMRFTVEAL